MISILIADDHAVVRKGLEQIISETQDMRVGAQVASGDEALTSIRASRFDVVMLDLNMPGRSGLDVLKQIKIERPHLPVLVLSVHSEDHYAVRVLRAGASGYLNKESAPEKLIEAIRRVVGGRKYVSAEVAEKLLSEMDRDTEGPLHDALSDREFQVMRMLASGHSVSEIAETLALSVKTISTYRTRVLEKMNMKSNAELTRYALSHHLVF